MALLPENRGFLHGKNAIYFESGAMIQNPTAHADILQEWGAVRKLCSSDRAYMIPDVGFINTSPPESFYNLPFILAYATLDQVLTQIIEEGTFQCEKKRPMLGDKMAASKTVIPWYSYDFVETGRIARNALAHEAILLNKSDCLSYIDAIEKELMTWGIL